jgi:DNA-binding CsgD family transcriptional regulator/tetratricopeptide (TPR) repeat protein
VQNGPRPFPFIGRRPELAVLHTELQRASTAEPRIVAVEAGPGMGKSALLSRFLEDAPLALVLRASGAEEETGLAWGVLGQMAQGAVAALGQQGGWPRPQGEADPLTVGAQLLDALGPLQRPGVLGIVLDDAHWADVPSLQALLFALRRLEADRVLVAVGMRPEEARGLGEPWRRLLDGERATRLRLGGLSAAELMELGAAAGVALSMPAARRLAEHTGGSPLHARALIDELDTGALQRSEGPLPAPRPYSSLVLSRLAACAPATEALVAAAAVLGVRAALSRVAEVAELDDVTAPLSEAVRSGLLSESGGPAAAEVTFPHPLVRAAVYTDLGPTRRRELHRRAALVVGPRESLGHRLAASLGPDADLATALAELGEEEASRWDMRSAGTHLLQAARVSPPGPDRGRWILAGVRSHFLVGQIATAEEARPELVDLPPSPERSYFLGHLAFWRARAGEADEELRRAWALLGDPQDAPALGVGIASQLAILMVLSYRFDEAMEWGDRCLAQSSSAPAVRGGALAVWAIAHALGGRFDEVAARLDALGSPEEAPPELLDAFVARGMVRLWTDALDGARADLEVVVARARLGHPVRMLGQAMAYLGEACYRGGALDDAVLHTELAVTVTEETGRDWDRTFVHALAADARAARGDIAEAEAHAEAARESATTLGLPAALAYAASAAASVAQAKGDPAALARVATSQQLPRGPGTYPFGPVQAEALVAAGDLEAAEVSLSAYETEASRFERSSAQLAAARVRVALEAARGRMEAADVAYQRGRAAAARTVQPLAEARLRATYGTALAASGRRAPARRELTEAAAAFEALGARPDLARAQAELVKVGGRFHSHPLTLTAQEAAVARLVADGLSNREAAARLVVSVKTIEYHLGHVYDKVGVRSRSQLVAKLRSGPA